MTPERAYEIANLILDEDPELVEQWAGRGRIRPSVTAVRGRL